MKDHRLKVFRATLDGLTESLSAVARVARWKDPDPPPEPLRTAVEKLGERLSSAGRLSSGSFNGSPADTSKVNEMCAVMKRLDAAYVAYRKQLEVAPNDVAEAAEALESDIAEATA
jgi:hypothetical protein